MVIKTTPGYQQFNVLFCKWVHPFCVSPTFSECLVWITIWAGLFSLVTQKMLKMVQKTKRTVYFIHTKNPWKIVSEVFRRSLIVGKYWAKKKIFIKSFKGKKNQEGIPGHTCFPLFSLEMKAMKEWEAELLTIFSLSSGS